MWLQCAVVVLLAVSCSGGSVKMVGTPVVYTNGNGGGADEVEAFPGGNNMFFEAGGNVCAAWWVPYDNIPDITVVSQLNAEPSGTQVKLFVKGVVRTGRVRIKVFAYLCGSSQIVAENPKLDSTALSLEPTRIPEDDQDNILEQIKKIVKQPSICHCKDNPA